MIFKHLKKRDWLFLIIIVLDIIAQVALELKMPEFTRKLSTLVTAGSQNAGNIQMGDIWYNGGMMALCAASSMVLAIINAFFISRLSANISRNIRKHMFMHVSKFSMKDINKFDTSSLITRNTNDVVQIQNFLAMGISLLFRAPITAIWAILKISNSDYRWTLATGITIGVMVLVVIVIILFALPKFKKIQKLTDELNSRTRENISGVRVIRAFDANDYQTNKFEKTNNKVYKNNLFVTLATGSLMPIITLLMNGLTLAIYWIGAYLVSEKNPLDIAGKTELVGNMTAFTSYAIQIVMSFMMLILIFALLPRVLVSSKRIKEVLDTKPSIEDGNKENNVHQGKIEFNNVSFSYNDDEKYSLKDISFTINPGETVAIIGPTGSGKTTLANLILREFDPQVGEIDLDGLNIKDYKLNDLNSRVSVAHQKATMFKGNVLSNIAYGDEKPDLDRVNKVIKISKSDFINNDRGLETSVSQGGTNFSGGQKQRLSIARALYKNSDVFIFDDTFSALDFKTDSEVRKGIKDEYNDKTIVIVAQRIGTVKSCDKIIVLNEGKIDSIGTHEELLKKSNLYKEIALSQLEKEEL